MAFWRFFTASLIAHLFLLFILLQNQIRPNPTDESFEFEVLKRPQVPASEKRKSLSYQQSGSHPNLQSSVSNQIQLSPDQLSGFLPGYRWQPTATLAGKDTYADTPLQDDPYAEWGKGAETFERIQDYNIYRILYERLNGRLYYPGVLARHKIQGIVLTRLVLNRNGECDWSKTKIRGREVYLQMFVLTLLKNTCKENFKAILAGRQLTNVDASFHFFIGEEDIVHPSNAIVGNTLFFRRYSQQSQMEWEMGPFNGLFPLPVVYLNFPWIFENYDRLVENKDPLKEFEKEFGN